MPITLKNAIPWGRSLREYQCIFNLPDHLTELNIVSLADGPASFNAELSALGGQVLSLDPIYQYSASQIKAQFEENAESIMQQVKASPDHWVWTYHKNPEDLLANRRHALSRFLDDFKQHPIRYKAGELPGTKIEQDDFDMALCSHFLFLYSEFFDVAFHIQAIEEMLRLAKEVRIFPLLTLKHDLCPYLKPVISHFSESGHQCLIETVHYELQRGGNEMLRIV